jgi:hypothetical protein
MSSSSPSSNPYSDNGYIAINLQEPASPNTKYFCNWCNRKLFYREQDKETGKHIWLCTACSIEFIPDNQLTKRKSVLKTPGPNVDFYGNVTGGDSISIAMMDDPNKKVSSTLYKQQKLTAAYEALQKKGFHFKTYEER